MWTAARINDRYGRSGDNVGGVSRQLAASVRLNPVDAGRQRLGDGEHGPILGHESHPWIIPRFVEARLGNNCGITSKCTLERARNREAMCASMFIRNRWNIRNVLLQDHDVLSAILRGRKIANAATSNVSFENVVGSLG
jgi:hypothetical protein